ncbi:hypothetical protein SAMN05216511_6914 [Streptomyces sp. KS_16]|nr:hypothetical protein BX261_0305 [Streptomyces sp. 2321.6]SDR58423.1 hypothetical protein SAMN05216511_6914 [Streptomyces sp. KS_16]SEB76292.1 hypothetical protein SAMN05428940_0307 [Streptomyces sp. 2133.1]SNC60645.1 hypothetical protein SAMN06272741_0308 [Streptomyces sp. 2114.4]
MFQDDQQFWFDTLRHLGLAVHGGSDVREREAEGHRRIGCGLPLRCPGSRVAGPARPWTSGVLQKPEQVPLTP